MFRLDPIKSRLQLWIFFSPGYKKVETPRHCQIEKDNEYQLIFKELEIKLQRNVIFFRKDKTN